MLKKVLENKKTSFWIIISSLLILTLLFIYLSSTPKNKDASFTGATYDVDKILYQSPLSSFLFFEETAPQYCISSNYGFYRKLPNDEDWTMSKELYEYPLKTDHLYDMFEIVGFLSEEVKDNLNKVKSIYRSDTYNGNNFYLVMEQKDGTVLITEGFKGYDDSEKLLIRWIFKLEKILE